MKNKILKTSFVVAIILYIIVGAYAVDMMSLPLCILALLFGSYLFIFSIINHDRWIFKPEEE